MYSITLVSMTFFQTFLSDEVEKGKERTEELKAQVNDSDAFKLLNSVVTKSERPVTGILLSLTSEVGRSRI